MARRARRTGIKVGYLSQEPQLDPEQDVRAAVMEGVGDTYNLIERFNKISDRFAEDVGEDEMTKLLEEQAKLQDAIDAAGGWELERKLEIAADSLRLPPWEAKIAKLSGGEKRRVRAVPPAAVRAGHAAARRADQPPGRRVDRVARTLSRGVSRARSSP